MAAHDELVDRFWAKVDRDAGCWLWKAGAQHGYGQFWSLAHGRSVRAHRMAWELSYGAVPDGRCVLHRCDNRACVRPGHLFLGTQADNMRDMAAKGRGALQHHNPRRRFDEAAYAAMQALARQGVTRHEIARRFGTDASTVSKVVRGLTWRAQS